MNNDEVSEVPPIVHEVLRSPGQPLDPDTRDFMEPRFGHDFSHVRVHTDTKAAESALAVNALAYTVGRDIVFGAGRYASGTATDNTLLAHELTHVVQQNGFEGKPQVSASVSQPGDPAEVQADTLSRQLTNEQASFPALTTAVNPDPVSGKNRLARLVNPASTHCMPGAHGIPGDPLGILTRVEANAKGKAQSAAILLAVGGAAVSIGVRPSSSRVIQAYQNRFGLPPRLGHGFLNRLSGEVKKTQDEATQGELERLSDRFQRIANNFDRVLRYRCIQGAVSMDDCDTHCTGRDASACEGVRTFFLCPTFWRLPDTSKATLLIHESFHMLFGFPGHGGSGVGRNLRHAECYASFVSDLFGTLTGTPVCPSPPQ